MAKGKTTKVGKQNLELTNLEKIFYPATGFRKGDVLEYYREISPILVPHLKDRPLTMKRFPDGVTGKYFYEKDAPKYTPEWVKTFSVKRSKAKYGDTSIDYILVNDPATLVWTVNLGNIEMHTFLAKAPKIEVPSFVVFDLDPGAPADVLTCATVAFELKDFFDKLELQTFVKVSGSKGLQMYLPLNGTATYDVTRPFAETVAKLMAEKLPKLVVSNMSKSLRVGKVLIDWSQNDDSKTTVVAYSMRANGDEPYISLPIEWSELSRALTKKDRDALYFTPKEALKRVDKLGDLFKPLLSLKQKLPKDFVNAITSTAAQAPKERRPAAAKETPTRNGTGMKAYRAKRNFAKTAEPRPAVKKKNTSVHHFVIQKHAASHLHYDFRLEMDGVLRSWAVPKGLSTKKGERRLAMHVEDHPLDYSDFEGTIAPGNYGAGTVMVWDHGTYTTNEGEPVREHKKGKLHVHLKGTKLQGEWALVRTGDDNKWLIFRVGDDGKAISKKLDDQSVISGRTMNQIRDHAGSAEWKSNRKSSGRRTGTTKSKRRN